MRPLIIFFAMVSLAACAVSPRQQPIGAELVQTCAEPRAEMCAAIYAPVCAITEADERVEYSNACVACSKPQTTGYISGPCPQ